jgi:hypothetical protein
MIAAMPIMHPVPPVNGTMVLHRISRTVLPQGRHDRRFQCHRRRPSWMMMSSERIRWLAATPYAAPIVHSHWEHGPLRARREPGAFGSASRSVGKPIFQRVAATNENSDEFFVDLAVAHRHMAPL